MASKEKKKAKKMIAAGIPPDQVAAWYEGKKAKSKSLVSKVTKVAAVASIPWTGAGGALLGYKAAQKERLQKQSAKTKLTTAKLIATGASPEEVFAYGRGRKKQKKKARATFKKTDIAVGVAAATIGTLGAAGVFAPGVGAVGAGAVGAGAAGAGAAGGAGAVGAGAAGAGAAAAGIGTAGAGAGGLGAILSGAAKAGGKILEKKKDAAAAPAGADFALAPGAEPMAIQNFLIPAIVVIGILLFLK